MSLIRIKGISLVELLISMGLGAMISIAALQAFVNTKQSLLIQQGLARIQENARIAHIVLGEAIESSGKLGCQAFMDEVGVYIDNAINPKSVGLDQPKRLSGVTYEQLPPLQLSSVVRQKIRPDSHFLLVHSLKKYHKLAQTVIPTDEEIFVKGHLHLKKNQIIALSDCSHVDFVLINEINHLNNNQITKIKLKPSQGPHFSKCYQRNAIIGALSSKLFYVGKTKRVNDTDNFIYALFSSDLNGRTLELIEGVEHMTIQYVFSNKETIHYLPYDRVQDWLKVVKVRVSLLLNSIEDALPEPKAYYIGQQKKIPKDRLMRMWWHFEWDIKGHG